MPSSVSKKMVVLFKIYGYDQYKQYEDFTESGTTVVTYVFDLIYNLSSTNRGPFIPAKFLGLKKLYAIINYRLVTNGTAKIYFVWGADTILVDDISSASAGTNAVNNTLIDLTPYMKDDILLLYCDLAGDGTNSSEAKLDYLQIIGVL